MRDVSHNSLSPIKYKNHENHKNLGALIPQSIYHVEDPGVRSLNAHYDSLKAHYDNRRLQVTEIHDHGGSIPISSNSESTALEHASISRRTIARDADERKHKLPLTETPYCFPAPGFSGSREVGIHLVYSYIISWIFHVRGLQIIHDLTAQPHIDSTSCICRRKSEQWVS